MDDDKSPCMCVPVNYRPSAVSYYFGTENDNFGLLAWIYSSTPYLQRQVPQKVAKPPHCCSYGQDE